jgi:hypothetical protein
MKVVTNAGRDPEADQAADHPARADAATGNLDAEHQAGERRSGQQQPA